VTARALLVCALASGALADASQAATATLGRGAYGEHVRYVAGAGERNDLTFTPIENSWPTAFVIGDPGATITAGRGCVSIDAHAAVCVATSGSMYDLRARLGDGDDVLRPAGFVQMTADGGPGDDQLFGGTWDDRLTGGGGLDELRGGEGDDVLRDGDGDNNAHADVLDGGGGFDWAGYELRARPVAVDLADPAPDGAAGEGDTLLGIEAVHGGSGDDRLAGDAGGNAFDDEGGRNELWGRGGDDEFRGAASGPVDCGGGDDSVRGVTRRVRLARDCELVVRAAGDEDFWVTAQPRLTATGMFMRMYCPGLDGEPLPCAGSATVRDGSGRRRVLARGPVPRGAFRRIVHLRLTAAGRALLERSAVEATIQLRGSGLPDIAWGVVLARRRS
jgi:hypothetical protein